MSTITLTIKPTNNPTIIKLEASSFLVKGSYEYANIDEAKNATLAQQLFHLPFVKTVYIASNFVALERYSIVEWEDVQEEVAEQVAAYINSGQAIVTEEREQKKQPITVYAESTPNPSVMKFVVNKKIVTSLCEFKNIDEAKNAPLAMKLFHFPFVKEVFMDNNYISITKYDIAQWQEITMEIREFIRDFIAEGNEVVSSQYIAPSSTAKELEEKVSSSAPLDATSEQIIAILDEYVKPAVASDGGNIQFVSFDVEKNLVTVVLQGACSGCPSSTITLKNGIETMLKDMLQNPSIQVVALNG